MVSDAVGRGQTQQQINQKKITDVSDMIYKNALIKQMSDRTRIGEVNSAKQLTDAMRTSPLEVPGMGKVSLDDWKSLDTKTKAYSYYAFDAKNRGDDKVMPYDEWSRSTSAPTAHELYKLAEADPEFGKWLTNYRESGAPSISFGEKADITADKYLTSPTGLSKDIDKHINSDTVQNKIMIGGGFSDPKIHNKIVEKETRSYIEQQIKSTQGEILESGYDGTDMVWIVKTKSGETITIRRPR